MNWIRSMFQDGVNGTVSSRRVITFLAFSLVAFEFLCELILGLDVKPHTLELMVYIVLAGLGLVSTEKFIKPKDGDNK